MTRPMKPRTQYRVVPVVMALSVVLGVALLFIPQQRGWGIGLLLILPLGIYRMVRLHQALGKDAGAALERRREEIAKRGVWRGQVGPMLIGLAVGLAWFVAMVALLVPTHSPTLITFVGGFGGILVMQFVAWLIIREGGLGRPRR